MKNDLYKIEVLIKGDGNELNRTFTIEVPNIDINKKDFETYKEYIDELEYYTNYEVSTEGWNLYGDNIEWREIFYHEIIDIINDLNQNPI